MESLRACEGGHARSTGAGVGGVAARQQGTVGSPSDAWKSGITAFDSDARVGREHTQFVDEQACKVCRKWIGVLIIATLNRDFA